MADIPPAAAATDLKPRAPSRRRGRTHRAFILLGSLTLFALALANHLSGTGERAPLWRLLLAILAFLYLWWFASLLFDLMFVWQRYIRQDEALRFLRAQVKHETFDRGTDPDDTSSGNTAPLPPPAPQSGEPQRVRETVS